MAKNDFQYGGWNSYTLQCGLITTLISSGDCTLQCGMWRSNRDSEFTKWQHPAMWYVALGWHAIEFVRWHHPAMWHVALQSWHWIRQVAAPCSVTGGSGMTYAIEFAQTSAILEFYISFRFRPHQWHHRSRHVILHQSPKFYPNWTTLGRKKWRHVDFQDGGFLDVRDLIITGSLKSPITTY